MAVFDYVANNADRKGGHCLLDEAGTIWGIDHGLCFHQQYKVRSVIWDWAGEPVPDGWLEDVDRARAAILGEAEAAAAFASLLDGGEVLATVDRMERMLEERRYPSPGPHRHYPWPLV
jgi:uncharacterized repeat protein (TIGR03843 family)